ncbi:MAG: cytochrome P450, partial [Myxococcales bacterium]|nr:cytochrome P450 [Myxococcales bacterium]
RMKHWSDESIALLSGVNTPEEMATHMAESWAFYEYIRETYRDLADAPPSPLLAALVAGTRGSDAPLAEDEAHSIILQLLIAGSDSSASMMGSALWILARDPALQSELRGDPAKIPVFLEEVLRLESPFQGHFRVAREDAELGGAKLRAGDRLMVLWASGNRDERQFEDPDRVRLDRRSATKHFGFGHGLHLCVGAPLARMEGRIVLEEILRRTTGFELAPGSVRHRPSAFVRTLEALPIRWTPR